MGQYLDMARGALAKARQATESGRSVLLQDYDRPARLRWTADPRPDLEADSALWERLLSVAYELDADDRNGLFGALHALRCLGAGLVVEAGKVRLGPGAMDAAEYLDCRRRWLLPHADRLARLLTSDLRGGDG